VQAGPDPVGDHPSREAAWRGSDDLAINQELNTVRAAKVEIVANHLLKELPSANGVIKDLGEADLHLKNRKSVAEAGGRIVCGHGQGQAAHPAVEERLDIVGAERIADGF